jgi:iron complex transport system substrate-binding protein
VKTTLPVALGAVFVAVLVYATRGGPRPSVERYDRIVSIVPSVTELLFAVGAGDQVVGVTTYCTWPPEARTKEKVGDLVLNFEKIAALRPDCVMSVGRMARDNNLALERMGIRVVEVYGESFEEIADQMRRLGRLTGHPERGEEEARRLMDRVRAVEERVRGKPAPRFYFESSFDPLWTATSKGYSGDAIRRAGGRNIFDDMPWTWGQISWELVLERDPDVIFIAHAEDARNLAARAGWERLKAVKSGRVHVVPKEAFVYPTARLVDGLELAAKHLHEPR